jgi:hypothetical protein
LKQVALLLSKQNQFSYAARPVASARRAACRVTHRRLLRLAQACRRLLRLRRASGCLDTPRGSSRGSSSTISPHVGSSSTTSPTPRVRVPRHVARLVTQLVVDYFASAACTVASARRAARRVPRRRLLRLTQARRRLLRLRHASGCLSTSRGSSSTTSPRAGSLSTTSPTPCVRLLRHVARLVAWLVAWLVVDYFAYAARPGASARRAARHVTRRRLLRLTQARRRLLHLHRASGCFSTSRDLSRDSSSTTSPRAGLSSTTSPTPRVRVPRHIAWLVTRLVIDYFTYTLRLVALARRAACRVTHRRLLRLAQARRRLLRLRRASRCLGTSRGSSRRSSSTTPPRNGSSSTTSTTPHVQCLGMSRGSSRGSSRRSSSTTSPPTRVRVPRHVARLVVDYFDYATRTVASACRVAHGRLLRLRHVSGCLGSSRGSSLTTPRIRLLRHIARLVAPLVIDCFSSRRLVVDYFAYAARPGASAHRAARVAVRRRLLRLDRVSGCLGTSRGS